MLLYNQEVGVTEYLHCLHLTCCVKEENGVNRCFFADKALMCEAVVVCSDSAAASTPITMRNKPQRDS